MERKSDVPGFAVPVAAAPAYLTAMVAAASAAGTVVVLGATGYLLLTRERLSGQVVSVPEVIVLLLLAAGSLAATVVMTLLSRAEFRLLRDPPVFTAEGVRLRVFARRGHDVFVPWHRLSRLRVADRGLRPFLLLEVVGAEDLVGGDPDKTRSLRRTAERFGGAPFAYALRGALIQAEELGEVVRRLSGGTVRLDY